MYLVLFIIGVVLNISLAIIIFSTVPLIITFGIIYLILLNFIYE